jgi:hypothetical protein
MDSLVVRIVFVQREGFGKVMAYPGFLSLVFGDFERANVQFVPVLLRKFGRPDYEKSAFIVSGREFVSAYDPMVLVTLCLLEGNASVRLPARFHDRLHALKI